MNHDAELGPDEPEHETRPNSPAPGNVQELTIPDDTGFLIVRFKPGTITGDHTDLGRAARETGRRFFVPSITCAPADRCRGRDRSCAQGRHESRDGGGPRSADSTLD